MVGSSDGAGDGSALVGQCEGGGVGSPAHGIPVPKPHPFVGASDGAGVVGERVGDSVGDMDGSVLGNGLGVPVGATVDGTGVVGGDVGSWILQTQP